MFQENTNDVDTTTTERKKHQSVANELQMMLLIDNRFLSSKLVCVIQRHLFEPLLGHLQHHPDLVIRGDNQWNQRK